MSSVYLVFEVKISLGHLASLRDKSSKSETCWNNRSYVRNSFSQRMLNMIRT